MILIGYLFYFCLLVVLVYAVILCRWMIGWMMYPTAIKNVSPHSNETISVVVAVRNEEKDILNCLRALNEQVCPNLEIIISDDFSEDTTIEIVKQFMNGNTSTNKVWRLIEATIGDGTGKKAALERAINSAVGNLIITTDADCTMGKYWAQSFDNCYKMTKAPMITGFVRLSPGSAWFEKFQALEFISLSGTGAASVIVGKPLMCNGANLAFTKSAFNEVGGYSYGGTLPSGDDTFLMLQLSKSGKGKVVFNKSDDGVITSKPITTMSQLISQRKRWASKVQFYKEGYIKTTGALFITVNIVLLIALFSGTAGFWSWSEVSLLWFIKALSDLVFLYPLSRFARQQQLLLLFLPAVIIYPFYALAGMVSSPGKVSYSWKGRDYTVSKKTNE